MRARRRAQMPPSIQLPIETPRLVLRDFRAADLEAVHAYASRDEVARYLIWGPNTPAQSREAIEGFLEDQRRRPRTHYDVGKVLKPQGALTFEFPHLLNLIEKVQFDTIYHEHYSYLSLLAVEQVLRAHGLRPFDVELLATHGGSLRLFCCHEAADHAETEALRALRATEADAGLGVAETYDGFAARVEAVCDSFRAFLSDARDEGRAVAAYGAAAKGNTFLNRCGVTRDDIVEVYDANPAKQGRSLPGSHVPIKAPDAVRTTRPDYVVILPWNLQDEIVRQLAFIGDWGGRFVVASPETRVLD